MSVSHPLIIKLKGVFQELMVLKKISDCTPECLNFCKIIEEIFLNGLKIRNEVVPSPWVWMNAVAFEMEKNKEIQRVFAYIRSIEETRNCRKVVTDVGKFRQLVRCCLKFQCLHVAVDVMVRQVGNKRLEWYSSLSVIGHEVLGEILLSVLLQASQLLFVLDTKNARFLDHSWEIPQTVNLTLVPCQSLGIVLTFYGEMAVIVKVEPGSVADEDKIIEPGDIIDELNDNIVTSESQGRLKNVLSNRNQPVNISIVKFYPPCLDLYKKCEKLRHFCKDVKSNKAEADELVYLGSCLIGKRGDVSVIETGIQTVKQETVGNKPVSIECRELDVVVSVNDEILMRHPYLRIASCGHSIHYPKHFAYIVGDGPCNTAVQYTCHVFKASNGDICGSVLMGLKLGFERTQCTA